jgi:hypothetical protein
MRPVGSGAHSAKTTASGRGCPHLLVRQGRQQHVLRVTSVGYIDHDVEALASDLILLSADRVIEANQASIQVECRAARVRQRHFFLPICRNAARGTRTQAKRNVRPMSTPILSASGGVLYLLDADHVV